MKKKFYKSLKFSIFYIIGLVIVTFLAYLSLPIFFNYQSYTNVLEKKIEKEHNIKINIKSKIKYNFIPSPRLIVHKVEVKDFLNDTEVLGDIEKIIFKIPFKRLSNLKNMHFESLEINNANINLNLEKFSKYKDFFLNKFQSKPIKIFNSKINFYENKNLIANINNVDAIYSSNNLYEEFILKGIFLNDNIYFNSKINKSNQNLFNVFKFGFRNLGFSAYINSLNAKDENGYYNGNTKLNYKGQKSNFDFSYKEGVIKIKKGNINTSFFRGKFNGDVIFAPYFQYDLNIDIKSLNFNKASERIFNSDHQNSKFKISNKINGILKINLDKIYSQSNLMKSLESKIEFINGDILFHKLLFNFGKIGASDITGKIVQNDGVNIFNFDLNIFIDNLKNLYNKFGFFPSIQNNITRSFFLSATINMNIPILRLKEISSDKKFDENEVKIIEKNFNSIFLEKNYKELFNFKNIKDFIESMIET